jgi:hypothetical protein
MHICVERCLRNACISFEVKPEFKYEPHLVLLNKLNLPYLSMGDPTCSLMFQRHLKPGITLIQYTVLSYTSIPMIEFHLQIKYSK